jgi:nucleoside-diphosphate-sugar epimerase
MKDKTLLIIGGTGFFAKSLLDFIIYSSKTNDIKNIILLSRGNFKINNLKNYQKKIPIRVIIGDILKLKKIPFADYIIYCALNYDYVKDHKTVSNYCKLAKKYHSKSKILYASSGAIYGQQPKTLNKITENYLSTNKRINFENKDKNLYSSIKIKNEKIIQKLAKFKIKVTIARCFAFVGKHLARDQHYVAGNFIKNVLNKEKIRIKSNYRVIRSYMHEYDLANWLLKIVNNANINCPIYNVGSDQGIDIRKLGFDLSRKYKLDVKFEKIVSNFEDRYVPSIQKAKKELKLSLKYNSLDAVNDVIHSIQNKL